MSSRPVVSYDDITLPYEPPVPEQPKKSQPPPKKRKRNNHKKHSTTSTHAPPPPQQQHWDDPTLAPDEADDDEAMDDESRELTHEEIWDDSALVDAWNSAMEEYEAYHGPDKEAWKKEPTHKSPLWYNVPPRNLPKKSNGQPNDSKPIDFDTFVPTHDPSLAGAADTTAVEEDPSQSLLTNVSQDDAFERAVQASYWSGYWTAVYHCHRQKQPEADSTLEAEDEQGISSSSEEEGNEFVSTQR